MSDDRIEGFIVGGVSITVANEGRCIVLSVSNRAQERPLQAALTEGQSSRLRRLLSAAEKRVAP